MESRQPPDTTATSAPADFEQVALSDESFVPRGVLASVGIVVAPPGSSRAFDALARRDLHHAERELASSLPAVQGAGFVAGRRALRAALEHLAPGTPIAPLLRTHRGAPVLPDGLTGSISHKRARAIAVAAPAAGAVIGVDLEERPLETEVKRHSIADRILTPAELDRLGGLDELAHREATLVHFALKEAVYKAIDPYVERYVRFAEVELDVGDNGTASVRLLLPEPGMRDVHVDAHWRFDGRWIIALARSHRR